MKKPQLITVAVAVLLTVGIYFGATTVPKKKPVTKTAGNNPDTSNGAPVSALTIDTFLIQAKKTLTADQVARLTSLENSVTRGAVKDQQLHVFHELAKFYYDTVNAFEPYAWYTAEAARLENSEKTLTFAARLFLERVMSSENEERRRWMAIQAKDLFERSLMINPGNDSNKVGLGAVNLFGGASSNPMVDGLSKMKEVADRDSTNVYAQKMLVQGDLWSGQYDKAITRLQRVIRLEPENPEPLLMLADIFERTGRKADAILWYQKSLAFIPGEEAKAEVRKRIEELKK